MTFLISDARSLSKYLKNIVSLGVSFNKSYVFPAFLISRCFFPDFRFIGDFASFLYFLLKKR